MPSQPRDKRQTFSRRSFLRGLCSAPVLFVPAPIGNFLLSSPIAQGFASPASSWTDLRFVPRYPVPSALEDVLRRVDPSQDTYVSEIYAFEILEQLQKWALALQNSPPGLEVLANSLDASITAGPFVPREVARRSRYGIDVLTRKFAGLHISGRENALNEIGRYLASLPKIQTAELEMTEIEQTSNSPLVVRTTIRYCLAGLNSEDSKEQRTGRWQIEWSKRSGQWLIQEWQAGDEILARALHPLFSEYTEEALGHEASFREQLLVGIDEWRTRLDGACGIDIYGNQGIAAGDYNNNGLDDLYVCQPAGLPNRLYRNRGDGTFEDVTESAGVAVLDGSSCALFADFENKGMQDLLVVTSSGPLLFLNQGNGKFSLKRDAFRFAQPPQGSFTHAAAADYDHDGHLDVYFCVYSYYAGLNQYRYPSPYFDARNGPPNFLFHNRGGAIFEDRTEASGLNKDNNRYSFACAWGDCNGDGWPDLYVANDFGRSNLYRNNHDGTFSTISEDAGVQDVGAGMSACWFDFDNDGRQDIYVGNMWSSAGMRVSAQPTFHPEDPESIRGFYRKHAEGNWMYKNTGNGKFQNVSVPAGVAMGRWAWSSDAWDFDHDGYPDLYVANGYISGAERTPDLSSFFWRQVVAKSPRSQAPFPPYENGWNAVNELIRSDSTWNGRERNVLYWNNRDGSFSEISGISGSDFADDGRAFSLADFDQDGKLEVAILNRTAPQLRLLRNTMKEIGASVAFRLRGTTSNRDAIGSAVTVEWAGRRQTKYLQAGSGFLSQHTKQLFFGLGQFNGNIRATIQWPSGRVQAFDNLPANHCVEIVEGEPAVHAVQFQSSVNAAKKESPSPTLTEAQSVETWLLEPLAAPDFSLPDVNGKVWQLHSLQGRTVVLHFWSAHSQASLTQLRLAAKYCGAAQILALCIDAPRDMSAAQTFLKQEKLLFPVLLPTEEILGTYNILFRYLFDRRRDLGVPTTFLVNAHGLVVKLYQGVVSPSRLMSDLGSMPHDSNERQQRALPFPGTLYQGTFQRNEFTYGVAFFQHGYLDQAAESFRRAIAQHPEEPEAYYNLGTLYLRKNDLAEARRYLEQAVQLKANYPEAWNNLGMLAAEQGQADEAARNFQQALSLRPDYTVAMVNLGNLYRHARSYSASEDLFRRALQLQPEDAEANYSMGMLYAQQGQIPEAEQYLQAAVRARPGYPDALNNLGVLFVREQRFTEAEAKFRSCIAAHPEFDQAYLNLARLYVIQRDNAKARAVLESLLQLKPGEKLARQALEMLQ